MEPVHGVEVPISRLILMQPVVTSPVGHSEQVFVCGSHAGGRLLCMTDSANPVEHTNAVDKITQTFVFISVELRLTDKQHENSKNCKHDTQSNFRRDYVL